jgi:hypothetical protein
MSFKQLNLHRDKILGAAQSYHPDIHVIEEQKNKGLTHLRLTLGDEAESLLNIHYAKDGTITLHPDPNRNPVLATAIATEILNNCSIQHFENRSIYIKNLPEEHFNDLLEFLQGCGAIIEGVKNLTGGVQRSVKSQYGDRVFLNRYDKGAIQVQGTHCLARTWVIEGLAELLPYKEVIDIQLKVIDVDANADDIVREFKEMLPNASQGLKDKFVVIMSPCVALWHINVPLTDYTMFVSPALRGLEGFLKQILSDSGIAIGPQGFSAIFDFSDQIQLSGYVQNIIKKPGTRKIIEDIYSYYHKHRHALSHMDYQIDTTRIIDTREEALEIIEEIFQKVEDSYNKLNA